MNDTRLPCILLARAAFGLFVVGLALFLAVSGCVGGGMCIRNTDCGAGSYCVKQQCVRHAVIEPDSGIDGGVDADAATSGGATANDTTDTGGAGTTGGAATAGGAGTSGSAGASGSAGTTGGAGTSGSAGTAGSAGTSGGGSGGV